MKNLWTGIILLLAPLLILARENKPLTYGWEFRQAGTEAWHRAEVPGSVHMDLFRNGMIPHPFAGQGEKELKWIENEDWEYRLEFNLTKEEFAHRQIDLKFDGLDTYADVFVNGKPCIRANNMFLGWKVNAKSLLKQGKNTMKVVFHSPIRETAAARMMYPYQLPADSDAADEKTSPFARKAGYHFGWDFSPRFVTMGIWKDVSLNLWDDAVLRDVQYRTLALTDSLALINGMAFITAEKGGKGKEIEFKVKLRDRVLWDTLFVLSGRKTVLPFELEIKDPERWWPSGYGAQKQYAFEHELVLNKGVIDGSRTKYGLRTVELVQEKDEWGESFYFKVNGTPIYAKGANAVPEAVFLGNTARQREVLQDAMKESHFNMVRLWGGGIYQDDHFYDWCDENGILVWQDFMFAGTMYPFGADFSKRVQKEAVQQILRLRNHPSIALWCGNNELEVAWKNWGWQAKYGYAPMDSFNIWEGYQELFQRQLPKVIENYDPDRPYVSTSPLSNWGKMEYFTRGNMHYWGVWHGPDDLDGYRKYVPRFMTEFGMQSYPFVESMAPYAEEGDLAWGTEWIENRQKSYKGNQHLMGFTHRNLGMPKDFRSAVMMTQLTQARAMEIAIEAQRARAPYCMGTLIWQLNDTWPGPSWSVLTSDGRRKSAYYALQRSYAPQMLTVEVEQKRPWIRLVDDTKSWKGELTIKVHDLKKGEIHTEKMEVSADDTGKWESNQGLPKKIFKRIQKGKAVASLVLKSNGIQVLEKVYHTDNLNNVQLTDPGITYTIEALPLKMGMKQFKVSITPKTFAKGIHLSTDKKGIRFKTNDFDGFPGHTYYVVITAKGKSKISASSLKEMIEIESLYDWRE